ncbi:MAG: hypothetical protein ACWGNV_11850 [Bacteroidales bacterium]
MKLKACRGPYMLLLLLLTACSGPADLTPEKVAYQDPKIEVSDDDPKNTYHILVPENLAPSQQLPLVIVLDSHGDGQMAAEKFQGAVRNFPCLVAGSDLIRNNFQGFENAILQLLEDILRKYPVDRKHIVISGFSGGARMAYRFAFRYPVSGVLMCGAGPEEQKPSCPVYTISGMGDFNFSEQYVHPDMGSFSNEAYTSDYFHGIHEWPKPDQLMDALFFLFRNLDDMTKIRHQRSLELIDVADSLELAGDEILAWKALEKSSKLADRPSVRKQADQRAGELLMNPNFQEAVRTLEQDLTEEGKLQQDYPRRLLSENADWWQREVDSLQKNLSDTGTGLKRDHFLRIKGYIGILLYSAINYTIHNDPENPQLKIMLETYAYAEPENPDVYFFRAMDAYHSGDRNLCIASINRALELGFSDPQRLNAAFPETILQSVSH